MNLTPNPQKALEILNEHREVIFWACLNDKQREAALAFSEAMAHLNGYILPPEVLEKYRCSRCQVTGVKLWRAAYSAQESWCAKCGCAQAGLPDDIGEDGRRKGDHDTSDQIYSYKKGENLLPWVPAPDGGTWGYTSVPNEGVLWWRSLPTRLEKRDPRQNPRAGDKLNLLGWKVEVIAVGELISYWRDGGRAEGGREMIHWTRLEWHLQMRPHATIVEVVP